MKRRKIILTIALIFVVFTAGVALYAFKEYNRKNIMLSDVKPDFTTNAIGLIEEFTANEKKAGSKYADKVILVSGTIKSADKDEKGYYTIILGDPADLFSVRCSMDSLFNPDPANIKQGVRVSIKGVCTGFNADEMGLGSDVILNRCVFVKP